MLSFWTRQNAKPLEDYRLRGLPDRVMVHIPSETNCPYASCGWVEFSQSAKLPDCPVCGGVGKVIAWQVTTLRARVVWAPTQLSYVLPTPGIELGDVTLGIIPDDLNTIVRVLNEQRAYIEVDGKTVRPTNTSPSVIPGVGVSYLVSCNLFTPTAS